ncbi:MAG: hypothetical protein RL375_3924 [Pseudomonadota bacterium]|jgi:phage I-like protein
MRFATALLSATLPLLANGQAQLLPAGQFSARDGRPGPGKSWSVTDERGVALAAAMNHVVASTPIVIDYEHQTLHKEKNGQPAPAAGWIKSVTWLSGKGLVSDVEWTDKARAAINAGEYRYISPVITWDRDSGAVTGVHLAALTNYPALLGMDAAVAALSSLTPTDDLQEPPMKLLLAALATMMGQAALATADEATAVAAVQAWKPQPAPLPEALTTALGLQAGADEAAALSAVGKLKSPDPVSMQTIAALQTQLAALSAQVNGDKVVATVDQAVKDGKLIPAMRDWALDLGRKDMAALSTYLAAAPVVALDGQTHGKTVPVGSQQTDALSAEIARGFGLTPEQFAKGAPKAA